ncbi:uncharacterized protein LOC111409228 [Olea europaea subsp. europaea]|uniref:Uncharacterized protein LOC111409228 n=1 Tax=Olea europaea subsp. europaea TaxID=158383 RepID=A0A8S0TFJ4_OLEEU|nr:uncharacterized protein LOC111409228 [Olea europaea subsp. europaea]
MGLFTYTIAGGSFILIGAWESFISASEILIQTPLSSSQNNIPTTKTRPFSSSVTFGSISVLAFLFIINSLISLYDALNIKDNTGFVLQLEVITISLLFLLYSVLGFFTNLKNSFRFPLKILNLIYLFAFVEEFLLFYMQKKDPSGIENRYYDLFLVPITICIFSTILELKNSESIYARLGRAVGLILQGMWILQMGFSFYSNLVAHGCNLHEKSRGNYTVKCKGHPEYHRGRAIATLQFNCHLALLVTLIVGAYSIICKKNGISRGFMLYKPLGDGGEMKQFDSQAQFTLDTDEEEDGNEIKEVRDVELQKAIVVVPESGVNGYGTH